MMREVEVGRVRERLDHLRRAGDEELLAATQTSRTPTTQTSTR